jgi:hypothetical protein
MRIGELAARAGVSPATCRYYIIAPIGEGWMGQVYRATNTTLRRQLAIKILSDAFASDPEGLARFGTRGEDARLARSRGVSASKGRDPLRWPRLGGRPK